MKIMIVAPHPDDETIGCAAKIIRNKNEALIVYLTDGEFYKDNLTRRMEAEKAMKIGGTKNLVFLKHKGVEFTKKEGVEKLIKELKSIIKKYKPEEIYVTAFEGGNYEHDIANYAINKAIDTGITIYEYPTYNNNLITLMKRVVRRTRRLLGMGFYRFKPRFLNKKGEVIKANMTKEEMQTKKEMLQEYKTQNYNDLLLKCYLYDDRYKICPKYDYTKMPHGLTKLLYEANSNTRFEDFLRVIR